MYIIKHHAVKRNGSGGVAPHTLTSAMHGCDVWVLAIVPSGKELLLSIGCEAE
jgi:hypothetical protein